MKSARSTLESLAKAVTIARRAGMRVLVTRASRKIGSEVGEQLRLYRSACVLRYADVRSRIRPIAPRSSPAPRLSVVVTHASDRRALTRTIRSFTGLRPPLQMEILTGASSDTTTAINEQLAQARGEYSMVVRAGAVAIGESVDILARFLDNEPQSEAAVPKVVDAGGNLVELRGQVMLFRTQVWRECGGLDARYDLPRALVDFALRLGAGNRHPAYLPASVFLWTGLRPMQDVGFARLSRGTIVAVDEFVPREDRDAGSKRLVALIRMMISLGYAVIFVPDQPGSQFPASRRLRELGCDVRTHEGDAASILRSVTAHIAWLSRPHIGERYADFVRTLGVRAVVYDTVDLHHLRLAREEALLGRTTGWEVVRERELGLIRAADAVVVTSRYERAMLEPIGIDGVVIPVVAEVPETCTPFDEREGLLFVGNFTHAPNLDALRCLVEILPRLRERLPGVTLDVVGFDPEGNARRLRRPGLRVRGHVASVDRYYERAKLLVAPLRFGAGVKGKIVESLAHGLPVVTTAIGAEGFGAAAERAMLVADDPEELVAAVVRAYEDVHVWSALSTAARSAAKTFSCEAVRPVLGELLESVMNAGASV